MDWWVLPRNANGLSWLDTWKSTHSVPITPRVTKAAEANARRMEAYLIQSNQDGRPAVPVAPRRHLNDKHMLPYTPDRTRVSLCIQKREKK